MKHENKLNGMFDKCMINYSVFKLAYRITTICFFSILFISCSNSPAKLLDKAEKLWGHNMDSVNIYISQIENPQLFHGREKMRYCYLKGVMDFYSQQKSSDSLLAEAKKEALLLSDSLYIRKLMMYDLIRFSYRNWPDSTLNTINQITNRFPTFADSIRLRLFLYRNESLLKKDKYHDVINNISSIKGNCIKNFSDSLLYIRVMLLAIDAYSMQKEYYKMDSIYTYIIEKYIPGNKNFVSRADYVHRHYLSKLEKQERWRDAISINDLLDEGNKEKAARNAYLKGRMYQQTGMQDSAVYFYRIAEQGHLPILASLASKRLMNYFLSAGYDDEAYKSLQRSNLIQENIENSISFGLSIDKFKQTQLKNELYQIRIKRQEQQLLLLVLLLVIAFLIIIYVYYYFRIKRERIITEMKMQQDKMEKESQILRYHNELLKKETEIMVLRESLFRRLSFYRKLPSLTNDKNVNVTEKGKKIIITEDEWHEIKQTVDTSFDNFSLRLEKAYPLLTLKDILFCCLVKLNVNMQDLSDIYCVSKAAISKRKFRIKTEKLNIADENISLDMYLRDF
ncbi:MAG: hypothetical protein SOX26_09125 [Phocaeicola sp.]|nr:hypothetical protein [Phocaeicola sp.]